MERECALPDKILAHGFERLLIAVDRQLEVGDRGLQRLHLCTHQHKPTVEVSNVVEVSHRLSSGWRRISDVATS